MLRAERGPLARADKREKEFRLSEMGDGGKMEIGITQAELRKQVVAALVDKLFDSMQGDDYSSGIAQQVRDGVTTKLTKAVAKRIDDEVLPLVKSKLDTLVIPKTNRYGEPKGEPQTFLEYAIERAENYMTEMVNYEGKSKGEDSYSWSGTQTRITHMVHKHLHYHIETAMKKALVDANSKIVSGIEATVKAKLKEISDTLRMEVKAK
jgi:hypothetical protein